MKILNALLNTGKTPELSTREERLLKFCNATVLIVLSFIVANLISLLAYGAYNSPFALIPVLHFILIAASLYFNHQKKYLIAKINFSVVAVVFVTIYAIAYGKAGQNFLFLPMIAFLVFNLFAPEEKQYMWMMLALASAAYLFVLYANHGGFESWFGLDQAFCEIQGNVALTGNLLLTLAFGMYNFFLIGSAENKLSEEHQVVVSQKRIIEKAHREITDSINYARRIQNGIMPSESSIKNCLKDSFVLYQPKDVVAGDFYWLMSVGDEVLFAVGDCTGHGVPGAMVSLICHNGLNRSVKEYNLRTPADVLEKTRDLIIGEFEKSELELKDGMDIAFCNLNGFSLSYAGANNPLWIIRQGELMEIKADRQPIGKFDYSGTFTNHSIPLQKGDSLYLFSDGFSDQLGGPENKRFTKNRLKSFLLAIQNKSMGDQQNLLLAELEEWKGTSSQTDDVCILGFRI